MVLFFFLMMVMGVAMAFAATATATRGFDFRGLLCVTAAAAARNLRFAFTQQGFD